MPYDGLERQEVTYTAGPDVALEFCFCCCTPGYGLGPSSYHNGFLPTPMPHKGSPGLHPSGAGSADDTMNRSTPILWSNNSAPDLMQSPASLGDSALSPETPLFQPRVPEGGPLKETEGICHASREELPPLESLEGTPPKMNKPFPSQPEGLPVPAPATVGPISMGFTSPGSMKSRRDESVQVLPSPPFIKCQEAYPVPSATSTKTAVRRHPFNNARPGKSLPEKRKEPAKKRYPGSKKQPKTETTPSPIIRCTFCIAEFGKISNWRRHESEVHLVLEEWTCRLCSRECPQMFSRKGHMQQHLKRMHKDTEWLPIYKSWRRDVPPPTASRCGFCEATFEDWGSRNKHVGHHFTFDRKKMKDWKGDLGLSEEWMLRAFPPSKQQSRQPRTHT